MLAASVRSNPQQVELLLNACSILQSLRRELQTGPLKRWDRDVAPRLVRAGFADAAAAALFSLLGMEAAWFAPEEERRQEAAEKAAARKAAGRRERSTAEPPLPDWRAWKFGSALAGVGSDVAVAPAGDDGAGVSYRVEKRLLWKEVRKPVHQVLDVILAGGPALVAAFQAVVLRRPETVAALTTAIRREIGHWDASATAAGGSGRHHLPQMAGQVLLAFVAAIAVVTTKAPAKESRPVWAAFFDDEGLKLVCAALRKLHAAPVLGRMELYSIVEALRLVHDLFTQIGHTKEVSAAAGTARDLAALLAEARALALAFCFSSWAPAAAGGDAVAGEWIHHARIAACNLAMTLERLSPPSPAEEEVLESAEAERAFEDASRAILHDRALTTMAGDIRGKAVAALKVLRLLIRKNPPASELDVRRAEQAVKSGLADTLCVVRSSQVRAHATCAMLVGARNISPPKHISIPFRCARRCPALAFPTSPRTFRLKRASTPSTCSLQSAPPC